MARPRRRNIPRAVHGRARRVYIAGMIRRARPAGRVRPDQRSVAIRTPITIMVTAIALSSTRHAAGLANSGRA